MELFRREPLRGLAEVALIRPVSLDPQRLCVGNTYGEFLALQLPRQSLTSYLGLQPKAGGTRAASLLARLILDDSVECDVPYSSAEYYMQLAIHALLYIVGILRFSVLLFSQ
jgi:hypothetical protein